jgi:hypothetical protein
MAIGQQAAQQIAAILCQNAGLPSGMAAEVAQRLISKSSGSGTASRTSKERLVTQDNITTNFRNKFRPSEQRPFPSQSATDGKDGTDGAGGAAGSDGAAGAAGAAGAPGAPGGLSVDDILRIIREYFDNPNRPGGEGPFPGPGGGGGGGGIDPWIQGTLRGLLGRIEALERKVQQGGKCGGQDVCSQLKAMQTRQQQIQGELDKMNKTLKDLKKKIAPLEERISDIEKYMPPEACP